MSVKRLVPLVLAAASVLASACSAPRLPEVTFFSAGTTVTTGPAQYCDKDNMSPCPVLRQDGVRLRVPPNKPVQVSVPDEIASAVWVIGFSYRTPAGKIEDTRTALFPAYQQRAYTLLPPDPGDQLLSASVQKFGTVMTLGNDGQIDFHASGVWLLDAAN